MTITDWPMAERPREKLLAQGANTLSDAELLAIFLRTGVKGKTAVDVAREILNQHSLRTLLSADCTTFCQTPGLGQVKYVTLQACLELSRRYLQSELQQNDNLFTHPEKVQQFLTQHLHSRKQEVLVSLFLDNRNRLIAFEEIATGTLTHVIVHPRELIKRVLHHHAAGIIIAHNHPTGDARPSREDCLLTTKLKDALALIDIRLIDHFIVGEDQIFSFVQEGLLI